MFAPRNIPDCGPIAREKLTRINSRDGMSKEEKSFGKIADHRKQFLKVKKVKLLRLLSCASNS